MLRSLNDLDRYTVLASDGDIGIVGDFFLDDERWTIRYLVVETGSLLHRRRVLISPISFRDPDWPSRRFPVALTVEQVKDSPSVDVEKPVSRQHERALHAHYGYPFYWGFSGLWGMNDYPAALAASKWREASEEPDDDAGDVHLRSVGEIRGYHLEGSDDSIGHVADFIVDDETWEVRYLVIDTRNWWFGKSVLLAPRWARRVSWWEKKVYVDRTREAIKNAPAWNPAEPIDQDLVARLREYWEGSATHVSP